MGIDDRKIKILQAIINDYIRTGEPVGSRTIAKNYDLGVGSATIRNEMADLEDMGYLEQPHASSGRVPSSKGYRLYVDKLMDNQILTAEEDLKIKQYIVDSAMLEVDKIVKQTSALLSELTQLTCVIEAPSVKKSFLKSIQLIKVDEHSLVTIILTDTGLIKNHIIKLHKVPDNDTLNKINEVMNARLVNLSIKQINLEVINQLKIDLGDYEELFNAILPALYETLNASDSSEVFMDGATNIFNYPEYNDIDKAKEMLSLLNDKESLLELINPQQKDITISIGDENYKPQAKDCSIISAEYSFGDRPIGTIGLIGPRRINYSKVIAIMAEVVKELNNILNNQKL